MKELTLQEIIELVSKSDFVAKEKVLSVITDPLQKKEALTSYGLGFDTAQSFWHTFTIRNITTKQGGIVVHGIDELLLKLQQAAPSERIYMYPFHDDKNVCSIFFHEDGIQLLGMIVLPNRIIGE